MKHITTVATLAAAIAILPKFALAQSDNTWFMPNPETAQCVPMSEDFHGAISTPFQFIAGVREAGGMIDKIIVRHPATGIRVVIITGQISNDKPAEAWSFANDADECRVLLRIDQQAGAIADPSQTN